MLPVTIIIQKNNDNVDPFATIVTTVCQLKATCIYLIKIHIESVFAYRCSLNGICHHYAYFLAGTCTIIFVSMHYVVGILNLT